MIDLTNGGKLTTDIEILDRFVDYIKKIVRVEAYDSFYNEEVATDGKFIGFTAIGLLSLVTDHDTDFVQGYIKARLGITQ